MRDIGLELPERGAGEVFLNRNTQRGKCFSSETYARKINFKVELDKLYTIGIGIIFSVEKKTRNWKENEFFRLRRNVMNQ